MAILVGALACTTDDDEPASDAPEPSAQLVSTGGGSLPGLEALRDASEEPFRASADESGRVRAIAGSFPVAADDPVGVVTKFLADNASVFGLDRPGIGLEHVSTRTHDGLTTVRFRQTYRGVPVEPGQLVATLADGALRTVNGGGLPPFGLQVLPVVSGQQAVATAAAGVEGVSVLGVPRRTIVADREGRLKLGWLVDLATPDGILAARVDATTGELLGRPSASLHDLVDKDLEVFHDFGTHSSEIQDDLSCAGDGPTAGDEEGYYLNPSQTAATHTVWENTIDLIKWYKQRFGWLGFDNDDTPQIEVHVGLAMATQNTIDVAGLYVNHCEDILIGVGHHDDKRLLGHEYTHGVQDHIGSLDYEGQSGAIAEGLANVIGHGYAGSMHLLDNQMLMVDYDDGCPASEDDIEDCPDYGRVHTNDAIVEHFFRLIADGDASKQINAIGDPKALRLAFRSMFGIPSDVTIRELTENVVGTANYFAAIGASGFTFDDACTVTRAHRVIHGLSGVGCTYPSDLEDDDGDGVANWMDDCNNNEPADLDGDGIPNVCDDDLDGDGIDNEADTCPSIWDPTNLDTDRDGRGDPCDSNKDGDNHLDSEDNCPLIWNNDQLDSDRDGQGDACDDMDLDGVVDARDNCPFDWNADQSNLDGDNLGDVCETDADGDGVDDSLDTDGVTDNCQWYPNADQADADDDGMGDVCDPCPAGADTVVGFTANPFNTGGELPGGPGSPGSTWTPGTILSDQDGDGVPDGCDEGGGGIRIQTAGGMEHVSAPLVGGTVAVPGEHPPGGTFDFPDPCATGQTREEEDAEDSEEADDDVVGTVMITGGPATGTVLLTDERGKVLGEAALADSAADVPFEEPPGVDLHLHFAADAGNVPASTAASYDFVACDGEEESVGQPDPPFGGFHELIGRDRYELVGPVGQGGAATGASTPSTGPAGADTTADGGSVTFDTVGPRPTVGPVKPGVPTTSTTAGCATTTTSSLGIVTSTTLKAVSPTITLVPCPTTTVPPTTTRPPVVTTTSRPQIGTTSTTWQIVTTTRPTFTTTTIRRIN